MKKNWGINMDVNMAVIWFVFALLLFIAEMLLPAFFLFWFGAGALVATVAAYFGFSMGVQWFLFLAVSGTLVVLSRKFFTSVTKEPTTKANIDAYIGMKGIVIEDIDPIKDTGIVRVKKEEWRADSNEYVRKGERVEVVGSEGVHLIVKKIGGD
jgi:membrane protein implicated in regulation of membrane protease activity